MAERALTYVERRQTTMPNGQTMRAAFTGNAKTWHPTVVNLLVLVVLEIGAYALLRFSFRQFHGG